MTIKVSTVTDSYFLSLTRTFTEVGGAGGRVTRGLTRWTLLARQLSG